MKKTLIIMMSTIMAAAMLSGCGTKGEAPAETTAVPTTVEETTAAPTTAEPTTVQPTTDEFEDYHVENHNYQIRYDENGDPYIIDTEEESNSGAGGAH